MQNFEVKNFISNNFDSLVREDHERMTDWKLINKFGQTLAVLSLPKNFMEKGDDDEYVDGIYETYIPQSHHMAHFTSNWTDPMKKEKVWVRFMNAFYRLKRNYINIKI